MLPYFPRSPPPCFPPVPGRPDRKRQACQVNQLDKLPFSPCPVLIFPPAGRPRRAKIAYFAVYCRVFRQKILVNRQTQKYLHKIFCAYCTNISHKFTKLKNQNFYIPQSVFASFKTQKCKLPLKKRGVYWHCRQGRATTPDPDGRNTEHDDNETGGCRSQAVTADVTPANAGQAFGQYVPNIPRQV